MKVGEFYQLKQYTNYPETEVQILDKYLNVIDTVKTEALDHVMISSEGKIDKVYSDVEYKSLLDNERDLVHNSNTYRSLEFDPNTMDNAIFYNKQFWQKKDSWYYYILVTDIDGNVLFDENTKYLTIDYRGSLKDKRFTSATVYAEDYAPAKNFERVVFDLKELKTMDIKDFLNTIVDKINLDLDEFIKYNSENGDLKEILSFIPY
jgi:hypothetical protein